MPPAAPRTEADPRPGPGLPRLGPWARRSSVEQVRLYTSASLHTVAWFLLAMGALAAAARLGSTRPTLVLVLAVVLLGTAASATVRPTLARGGRPRPLTAGRGWLLLVTAVTAALSGWGATLDVRTGSAVVLVGAGTLGWVAGAYADRRLLWAATVLAGLAAWVAGGTLFLTAYAAGFALFFGFTVTSSLWLLHLVTELDRAQGTRAALAVAEERLRFSRDVHDVLGRHLSTIAVQAELASTLADRGDARAGEKILEVRSTAHDALREARELARGYRPLDLGQELDGAVSLLRSAGIRATADVGGLPEAWHEPVARVVREAVTNVLRHSDARSVRISWSGDELEVADDGSRRSSTGAGDPDAVGAAGGSGLASLAEDLAPLGARLQAGPDEHGFHVRVRWDTDRPVLLTRVEESV